MANTSTKTLTGEATMNITKNGGYIRIRTDEGEVHNLRATKHIVDSYKELGDPKTPLYVELDTQTSIVGEEYVKRDSEGNATIMVAGYKDGNIYDGLKDGDEIVSVLNVVKGNLLTIEDRKANASLMEKARILKGLVDQGFTPDQLTNML